VFFDVWQQAGRFEGRSAVTTWLLSIARFKALSARRRRSDAELDETIETTVADSADDPETALQNKSRNEVLRQAVMKLSPDHREIIDLVYYHEKSVDDCATILGIPAATVKTRMFYGRKKLAQLVQGRRKPDHLLGRGRRLWRKLGPPYPILSGAMWPGGHIEKFSERLTDCLLVGLNLAGATVPPA
jgi:RNA polymerase sigma-70 factor, ECF subfamily